MKRVPKAGEYVMPTLACARMFSDEVKRGTKYRVLQVLKTPRTSHYFMHLKGVRGEWDLGWFRGEKA